MERGPTVKRVVAILAIVASLATSVAYADNSTSVKGYGGQAKVQTQIDQPKLEVRGVQATATTGGGSLPVTGVDLGLLVLGGGAFILVGFGMRRVTRGSE